MENKSKVQDTAVSTAVLPFRATVSTGEYFDEATNGMREFVNCILDNPFDDPDFTDIRISPKWKSAKGTFDFKAKKILRSQGSFEIKGEIKLGTYFNKKKKRKVVYPGMFVENPFGDGTIEFGVKREEDAAVFSMLASDYFKTQLETETAEAESPNN